MCQHIKKAAEHSKPLPKGKDFVCKQCVELGDMWVHLRTCQTCGETHCCDSSKNTHATKHNLATGHPVIQSAQPEDDGWFWCYPDQEFAERRTATLA